MIQMIMRAADDVGMIHLIRRQWGWHSAFRDGCKKYIQKNNPSGQFDYKTGLTEPPQRHGSARRIEIPNFAAQFFRSR